MAQDNMSPQGPHQGKSRWRIVLVLSLGVNLVFVGLIAGALLRGGPADHQRPDREVSVLGLRGYMPALKGSDRRAIRSTAKDRRGELKMGRVAFRAHLEALAESLGATPYDEAAVKMVLENQAMAVRGNITLGQQILLARISEMNPKQRASFAKRLLEPRRKPHANQTP